MIKRIGKVNYAVKRRRSGHRSFGHLHRQRRKVGFLTLEIQASILEALSDPLWDEE